MMAKTTTSRRLRLRHSAADRCRLASESAAADAGLVCAPEAFADCGTTAHRTGTACETPKGRCSQIHTAKDRVRNVHNLQVPSL